LQGASILTGLGFTGFTPSGDSLWEGAANVKVLSIEVPPNFKVLLDSWNMKTNVWLRECVYKRVTPKGKKPGFKSSMITFATSAFWVGFVMMPFSTGQSFTSFFFLAFVARNSRRILPHLPFWRICDNRRSPLPFQYPSTRPSTDRIHQTHLRYSRHLDHHPNSELCRCPIYAVDHQELSFCLATAGVVRNLDYWGYTGVLLCRWVEGTREDEGSTTKGKNHDERNVSQK
jgi:hypothetical protein